LLIFQFDVIDSYCLTLKEKETAMKKMLSSVVLCVTWGGAGALAFESMEERTAKELGKYNQTGNFEQCIAYNLIEKTTVLDNTKIIFELKNDKVMLNTMKSNCARLGIERKFSFPVSTNRLCGKDVISTINGTCNLSDFQILEKKS